MGACNAKPRQGSPPPPPNVFVPTGQRPSSQPQPCRLSKSRLLQHTSSVSSPTHINQDTYSASVRMADSTENPLLSTRPSDTGLTVALHPLVLLTISDHVTRQSLRKHTGPVAGALLGQQKGREITVEHAFPTDLVQDKAKQWGFDVTWMEGRIQQYRDVHKAPALDFVGWYTLGPESGPSIAHVSLQRQAMTFYNESAILLVLHPEILTSSTTTNGRLPVSIYESLQEPEPQTDDASMQVDGQETAGQDLKFRSLPYTIETDETEMIAIDYVAKGAGSAAAVTDALQSSSDPSASTTKSDISKGKAKLSSLDTNDTPEPSFDTTTVLTPEEEDAIASTTTRLNSVKMLQSRISLLRQFIQSLPPSYLSDQNSSASPDHTHLPHLRNIQALLTRLSLLTPAPTSGDKTSSSQGPLPIASQAQSNDVSLSNLLSLLSQDVQALSEVGRKFYTVQYNQSNKTPKPFRDPTSNAGGGAGGTGGPGGGSSRGGFVGGNGGGSKGTGSGAGGFSGLEDGDGRFGGVASLSGFGSGGGGSSLTADAPPLPIVTPTAFISAGGGYAGTTLYD